MSEPSKIVPFHKPNIANTAGPLFKLSFWETLVGDNYQALLDYLGILPHDWQSYKLNKKPLPKDLQDLFNDDLAKAGLWASKCLCGDNCGHDSKFTKIRNAFISTKNLRKMTNALGISPTDWVRSCVHENVFPSIQKYLETHKGELWPGSDPAFLVKPSDNEPIFFELYDMVIDPSAFDSRKLHAERRAKRKEAYMKDKET